MAIGASLEHLAHSQDNPKAQVLSTALDTATQQFLQNNKSPARRLGQIDNRGSHFYLAKYWAEALAAQKEDKELAEKFKVVSDALNKNEEQINTELIGVQNKTQDIGGYYYMNDERASKAMRPSQTLNGIIEAM